MARPQIDNTRRPPSGPYLRYAQIYSVSAGVARVRWLRFDFGTLSFVTYGSDFPIGGSWQSADVGKQVWVTWRSDAGLWFPITGPSAGEKFRLIRGTAYGNVAAGSTSFYIKNVIVLAGGIDPRSDPDNPNEIVEVTNSQKEAFDDEEYVVAIWQENDFADPGWSTFISERYRALRGQVYSQSGTMLQVDHIVALDSGLDPRIDPSSVTERISVTILNGDTFTNEDKAWADYNVKDNRWESRPKGGAVTCAWGLITVTASPSTIPGTPSTDCQVTLFGDFGGTVLSGVKNYYPSSTAVYGKTASVKLTPVGWVLDDWSCESFPE